MIYANIAYADDEYGKGYVLGFYWENSIQEIDLWNTIILENNKTDLQKAINFEWKYLKYKSIILTHLAERWFIPWGDNIFYKKGLLNFFR
jgi:hypothetical protein